MLVREASGSFHIAAALALAGLLLHEFVGYQKICLCMLHRQAHTVMLVEISLKLNGGIAEGGVVGKVLPHGRVEKAVGFTGADAHES